MDDFLNTDKELFHQIKKNKSNALSTLFNKYYVQLCRFSYTYVKSVDLAEEVVSDVFYNIWVNRKKIEIKSNLKTYLYSATRNISINYLAKESRTWENIETIGLENIVSENSPEKILNQKELEKLIESLIKKLPKKRQLVFRLNRIDGLSYKEIARILSISVNTVQNHMVKAVEFIYNQYPKIDAMLTIVVLTFFIQ